MKISIEILWGGTERVSIVHTIKNDLARKDIENILAESLYHLKDTQVRKSANITLENEDISSEYNINLDADNEKNNIERIEQMIDSILVFGDGGLKKHKRKTQIQKVVGIIIEYFIDVSFSSTDVVDKYKYNFGKINESSVRTYISRMRNKGFLKQSGNQQNRKYCLNKEMLFDLGEEYAIDVEPQIAEESSSKERDLIKEMRYRIDIPTNIIPPKRYKLSSARK